jgi:hypothetical protein
MKCRHGFRCKEDFSIPKIEVGGSFETLVSFGLTSQKTVIFLVTAVRTSNLKHYMDEKIKDGDMDKICSMLGSNEKCIRHFLVVEPEVRDHLG